MSTYARFEPRLRPRKLTKIPPKEEIVISGIAGRFPESDNVQELHKNLINTTDLLTDDDRRWNLDDPEIPKHTGKVNNVEKFDADFFGVHFKQAHAMDPMCRMLLEHAYEAIIDAGVNPTCIRGTNTGVFIGACFSESEKTLLYDKPQKNGFGIIGYSRSMLANEISYCLGITGPSYAIDSACSSSLYALENAYKAMREGSCDAAIVGGAQLCLHPYISLQFSKLDVLSTDGRCKTFDEATCGYESDESITVAFLQRAKDAKRVYATLVCAKTNCDDFKERSVTFPSSQMQSIILDEYYLECGVSPLHVSYIETHTEPASGLLSAIKILLAMETGVLQPNINFKNARQEIKVFAEERIRVVSDPTPWNGGYAAINYFGFGGANCHILLKSNPKKKVNKWAPNDNLPRLVAVSGRSNDAVSAILKDLESKPVDVEYVRLLHDIHSENVSGHLYKGYTILSPRGVTDTPIKDIKSAIGVKRPIWFVFSGVGSQWPGMAEGLLRIPAFFNAIKKCNAVLQPRGIDIFYIITNKDKTVFDSILYLFVGVVAVQIGLVDLLQLIAIKPDNIIGHSVGELGCAYADGCFTAEQTIMSAYSLGLACVETNIIQGSMAAVGLGYKYLKDMCPHDIEVACHNASGSATICGPTKSMKNFIIELQARKIFTMEVACCDIPFHSHYVASIGPKYFAYLKTIIPDPKPRSSKWLSTSVSIDKWDSSAARFSSPKYYMNNLLSAVLFEETAALIPKDAITIEIAPHGLLQAILRRSLNPSVANIPLTKRDHRNNVEVLLQAFGKMFILGLHLQLANLYPRVEYPVSCATQMISPLIKWEHTNDWFVASYKSEGNTSSGERIAKVALSNKDYEFIVGHVIDERILFPAMGYLVLIWKTFSIMQDKFYTEISVVFEDVKFIKSTTISKDKEIEFTLTIQKETGSFSIDEGGAVVVTGFVRETTDPQAEKIKVNIPVNNDDETMTADDVYKELRLRGYHYSGLFRSITRSTINGSKGHIFWHSNWGVFMDNMIQIQIFGKDTRGLFMPASIKKLTIDTATHLGQIKLNATKTEFPVFVNTLHDVIISGGVEIRGLKTSRD